MIDFTASLNDPIREVQVCRIDTFAGLPVTNCFAASQIVGGTLMAGYGEGTHCYHSEAQLSVFPLCNYIDSTSSWYKVFVKVKNHCSEEDTQTIYFFVDEKIPTPVISLPNIGCPGVGTVIAIDSSTVPSVYSLWNVQLVDTNQYQENDESMHYYGGDWEVVNQHFGDTFAFPGFNWIGGYKYAVSHTKFNTCGEASSLTDTIEIQPGAKIWASPGAVYSQPLGPGSLKLDGFVGNADSYSWAPTSYLDNPYILSPIATPPDTITYILTSTKGACNASDTLFIRYNRMAFAGNADTVCGDPVLLGVDFDASLFLGYQHYENEISVENLMSTRLQIDSSFFDKLSIYMLTEDGRDQLNQCQSHLYNFMNTVDRQQFYNEGWYKTYIQLFHQEHGYQSAFQFFDSIIDQNNSLMNYISSNPVYSESCLNGFLNQYWVYIQSYQGEPIITSWEKFAWQDTQWVNLTQWSNEVKVVDTPFTSSLYKITVIDNHNSVVEFDQVGIWSEHELEPFFYVNLQTDSTVYFANETSPFEVTNNYFWEFGDGDSSNQVNPVHTYPIFDTSYIVSLTASNLCGTFTYVDTIFVDSAGIIGSWMTKPKSMENKGISQGSSQMSSGFEMIAYPNPTSGELHIRFKSESNFDQGLFELTNSIGQRVAIRVFKGKIGDLVIDTQYLAPGIYSIICFIDGQRVNVQKVIKN